MYDYIQISKYYILYSQVGITNDIINSDLVTI